MPGDGDNVYPIEYTIPEEKSNSNDSFIFKRNNSADTANFNKLYNTFKQFDYELLTYQEILKLFYKEFQEPFRDGGRHFYRLKKDMLDTILQLDLKLLGYPYGARPLQMHNFKLDLSAAYPNLKLKNNSTLVVTFENNKYFLKSNCNERRNISNSFYLAKKEGQYYGIYEAIKTLKESELLKMNLLFQTIFQKITPIQYFISKTYDKGNEWKILEKLDLKDEIGLVTPIGYQRPDGKYKCYNTTSSEQVTLEEISTILTCKDIVFVDNVTFGSSSGFQDDYIYKQKNCTIELSSTQNDNTNSLLKFNPPLPEKKVVLDFSYDPNRTYSRE